MYRECRSQPDLTRNVDRSALAFDRVFHNRQSESGSPGLTRARFIHPIETLEDAMKVVGRDAVACVGHRKVERTVLAFCRNADLAAGFVVMNCIVDKVR